MRFDELRGHLLLPVGHFAAGRDEPQVRATDGRDPEHDSADVIGTLLAQKSAEGAQRQGEASPICV